MNFTPGISPDWSFNRLLDTIACDISEQMFLELKQKLKGTCSLVDDVFQRVDSASDLFEELKDRQLLDRNNQDHLYKILQEIGNTDLMMQTMNYNKLHGHEIDFQRVLKEKPDEGFGYITTCITGMDAGIFDMAFLSDFKSNISSYFMIPTTHCFIVGIEPTSEPSTKSGIKITFMVPDLYVKVLEKWMTENKDVKQIQKLRIESIKTQNKIFEITGLPDKTSEEDSPFKAMASLYENLQEREKDLNRAEELIQEQIDQLGKINCLPDRLFRLHQKSGMSITLWKTLVKTRNGKIASQYIPQQSHIDIEKESLHSKILRIYPQIKEETCRRHKRSLREAGTNKINS